MASQGAIHQGFKNAKCREGRKFRQIYRASRHLESERVLYITRQRKKKGKKNHLKVLLYLKRKQNLPSVSWQFPQEASLALLHHSSTLSVPIAALQPPLQHTQPCFLCRVQMSTPQASPSPLRAISRTSGLAQAARIINPSTHSLSSSDRASLTMETTEGRQLPAAPFAVTHFPGNSSALGASSHVLTAEHRSRRQRKRGCVPKGLSQIGLVVEDDERPVKTKEFDKNRDEA